MPHPPTISACLVVYNEEKVMRRCLDSLKDAVDEIILVHDGECADRTLEIAKEYTDKIFVQKHIGLAEYHRVFAFEQATGDWILWVDADEILSPELAKALPTLVKDPAVDAYQVIWPLWDGEKTLTTDWPWRPVLFRKSKLFFLGFPQEALQTSGTVKKVPLIMRHQPQYNNLTWKNFRQKWLKWVTIHAQEMLKPFEEIPRFQYPATDWPKNFRFARDHAYLFPLYGLYVFLISLLGGAWKKGLASWKSSFYWGLYNSCLYYQVWKLQRAAKSQP